MAGAQHGGAETAFVDLCAAMAESSVEVTVVSRPNPRLERLRALGLAVHTLPFGGPLDLYTGWGLGRIVRRIRPDILQTWMSRAARHIPHAVGVPVVSRLGGYYKRRHFPRTDYFTTITPALREWLIGQGVAPERVRTVLNFAETDDPATPPLPRASVQTPEGTPLILALGRLHPSKALDTLLRALVDVPDVWLWIAGEGPERANLMALTRALKLDDRVRFLGWRDDRAALFGACDLCVFPSRYEPFGTVFVQAWAHAKPLVVTLSDGPRQFVRDNVDALAVPVDDPKALSAAIRRIVDDADLRARLTREGRAHYERAFTKEACVASYLTFYRDILDGRVTPLSKKNEKV
ncbi:MAG TPA: glycosyltransferase [Alphaproteobacteria bacterium]|nr:glycosyltransferase [Alphaproteobacteria bacterium]